MHACICVCVCVWGGVGVCVCVCLCMCVDEHVFMHICTFVYVNNVCEACMCEACLNSPAYTEANLGVCQQYVFIFSSQTLCYAL